MSRVPARWATGIASAAVVMAMIVVVSRVVGFGRWVVQAGTVGRGCVGDVYAAANQLPTVAYEVVAGGALAAAVVPVLAPMIARDGSPGARDGEPTTGRGRQTAPDPQTRTVSALLTWAVLITTPLAITIALLADPLARLLAPGGCAGEVEFGRRLLLVFAPQVVLYAVGVVLAGVLQSRRRFIGPALVPLASSAVVIVSYLVVGVTIDGAHDDIPALPVSSEAWLAWGTTAGVAALSLPLLIPVLRELPGLRPTLRFPTGVGAEVRAQAAGGIAALLAQQVFVLTVLLASRHDAAPVGTLNVFQYTQAVYLLPFAVLVVPLVTSAFPALAAVRDRPERVAGLSASLVRAALALGVLGTAVTVAVAPAVERFFDVIEGSGRGVAGMAVALTAMALGLTGYAVMTLAARALQAVGAARDAALGQVAGWALAMVMGLGLMGTLGADRTLLALCLGSAAGMSVGGALLTVALRRRLGVGAVAGVARLLGVAGLAGVLVAGLGWTVTHWLVTGPLVGDDGGGAWAAVLVGVLVAPVVSVPLLVLFARLEPQVGERLRGVSVRVRGAVSRRAGGGGRR